LCRLCTGQSFEIFAKRNPKACPVIEKLEAGSRFTRIVAEGADIAMTLPQYRIYRYGILTETCFNIESHWQDDFVTFLIGCSFTFEAALMAGGIEMRHIAQGCNVPMYRTNLPCENAGVFEGPVVVSMRPIPKHLVARAIEITAQFPSVHGTPIHVGDPSQIGITNLNAPDYGDCVEVKADEVPVFWACGVTPQAACAQAKPDIMITHAPGHMFIADVKNEALAR
jgi:uncharacterized protein YcsI (UPF0317 family)